MRMGAVAVNVYFSLTSVTLPIPLAVQFTALQTLLAITTLLLVSYPPFISSTVGSS